MRPGNRALQFAALFFAVGAVLHNYDHLRRGTDTLSSELLWVGRAGIALSAALIVMALIRHRYAPHAAAIGGVVLAAGFVAAHWLPTWSVFSDSFVEGGASALSQVASMLEIVGALVFAATGYYAYRARRTSRSVASPARAA
ncbi:MAG TPA: hypothetical protein VHI54_08420 [Actinomycetota bacterium]|nr:hypothetical protein [Actinomycetota bacterium]